MSKRKPKPCLILMCLTLLSLLMICGGCSKPYIPSDFAADLDARIIEDRAALKLTTDPVCAEFIEADLNFLLELRAASK